MVQKPESTTEKLERLALLEAKLKMQQGLPHLYGDPMYQWQHDFFTSTNRYNFLCAANQIGKSSIQIRKMIHWATEPKLWPKLWRKRPLTFWYLYPSKGLATIEVLKKWVEEFLPRAEFKDHPQYGWKLEIKNKEVFAIHFNTGVSTFIKTYAQDVMDLQAGTVWAIFSDEELPWALYPELNMRLSANSGYFHMAFTATIGQLEWEECIEHIGEPEERFKTAFKRQVSLYDCLKYMDGSASPWTEEMITERINSCGTEAEVLRRIFGRFIKSEGLKYAAFSRSRNIGPGTIPVPQSWLYYAGVDIGSGGESNHPAAISVIAVSPDFKQGRVVRGWRGDRAQETNAGDVLRKYLELTHGLNITRAFYDYASKEFGIIAGRNSVPFEPADKSHTRGESTLNVLFKNQILFIDDTEDLKPLVHEFASLSTDTPKTKAKDDFIDSCRYATVSIPWDWTVIQGSKEIVLESQAAKTADELANEKRQADAKAWKQGILKAPDFGIEEEMEAWSDLYDY